ncbi:ABC transporter permease [Deinococcus yavapaiensis]|uniref:ABC-2 type transport system permease protein n=1 Tax=Deinococcus yavapaiensis KR-236 TaxID=694435 RepID=A0A318S8N0_9DEIO|nr:ABC transporter permease [Deinococcus yavapaiensis]PYE53383.1 ABC-2 type transport system permease protein [Deinococcus yavapaiensis KR-236]
MTPPSLSIASRGSFGSLVNVEWLKFRRTAVVVIPLIAALGFAALALFAARQATGDDATRLGGRWAFAVFLLAAVWSSMWSVFGTAVVSGMAADLENRMGTWRALRARPTSPASLWLAKFTFVALVTLLAHVLLFVATVLGGLVVLGAGDIPLVAFAGIAGLLWLVSLPLVALHLWIGGWRGVGASVLVGVVGLMAGQLLPSVLRWRDVWMVLPWEWPTHARGLVPSLLQGSVPSEATLLIGLAVVSSVLFLLAAATWFTRREDR